MTGYSDCINKFEIKDFYCPFCKSDVTIHELEVKNEAYGYLSRLYSTETKLTVQCNKCKKVFKLQIDEDLDIKFIFE